MFSASRFCAVWSLVFLLALVGCGSADEPSSVLFAIDDGASAGQATSVVVSANKSATLKLKSGAELTIGEGALDKDTEIGIARPKDSQAVQLVQTLDAKDTPASAPYVLTPHGTAFKKGVVLQVPIAKDASKQNLVFAWLADEKDKEWKTAGVAQVSGEKASIELKHFSVLMLVERRGLPELPGLDASVAGPDAETPMARDAGPTNKPDAGTAGTPDAGCISTFRCDAVLPSCGMVADNCGLSHSLESECGRGCSAGQACTNNACSPAACVPLDCPAALAQAGTTCHPALSDGCGGTLNCSTCDEYENFPQVCRDNDPGAAELWGCTIVCATRPDCPANLNTCNGTDSINVISWQCGPEGTCIVSAVLGDCPNGCQNDACLP